MSIVVANGIQPDEQKVIEGYAQVETKNKSDVLDALNSTNVPLVANAQFSGQWVDVSAFNSLFISWLSNQNSASNGMRMQFSADANTVDWSWETTTTANQVRTFNIPTYYKYFRIIYINTTNAQATFRLNVTKSYKRADLRTQTSEFTLVGTAAVNALVNVTLPAQGQGTVHYITSIIVEKFATALLPTGVLI